MRDGQIAALLRDKPRHITTSAHRRFRQLTIEHVDQLVREYCNGVESVLKLAKANGVSETTVARRLRERGLKLGRLPLTKIEVERAKELRKQGLSLNAIGRALGRDPKTIKAAII